MSDDQPHNRQPAATNGKIVRKQEAAIAALLVSVTVEAAAQACGVSERTLRYWRANPAFKAAFQEAQRALLAQSVNGLHSAFASAVTVLRTIAESPAQPAAPRVAAAKAIIECSMRARELIEMDERLTAVEAKLQERTAK